jgi:subtilisin family serine protease
MAHAALQHGLGMAAGSVLAAEPDLEQTWPWPETSAQAFAARSADAPADGEKGAPFDQGGAFGWHLDEAHSGLAAARAAVDKASQEAITIVHLDTGYDPGHRALPVNLDHAREKNFVEPTSPTAEDRTPSSGLLTNRGHGTGTLGILAGGSAEGMSSGVAIPPGFGPIGGAPFAKVVPVRIANSVVHFSTSTVASGINYARQIKADVVSMSMGGLPSDLWADAVNAAYEEGVVVVCAAGNSFGGLPTSLIVYPARFRRVIAACGVMAKGHPYYGLGGPMEGCAGPASKMRTAMAGFTPNIPWLRLGRPDIVDMDGAGTSSATPQVAAAAALWLARHGQGLERDWRRVESVRAALFGSADHRDGNADGADPLLGRGALRAARALEQPIPGDLRETQRDTASFAFLHLLTSVFGIAGAADPKVQQSLSLELTQLALANPGARAAVPDPDVDPNVSPITPSQQRRFLQAILDANTLSRTLRSYIEAHLGTGAAVQTPAAPPPQAQDGMVMRHGSQLPWLKPDATPTYRRVRVFATDPGDTSRLATSLVSMATIAVPWEKLEPGPIGEYVEVVDVDPASRAAYDPVDLDDPRALAQDGFAPSEGNPKFHQQMAYAVAMRTVRNFEVALGRPVLWAERLRRPAEGAVSVPNGGYVQRLRIYPHALREANAYYSPERKALLFGYFRNAGTAGAGGTIFTCLSHDVVAHETTHALVDGLHRRYQEPTNPDVLALHEAFADIVAIFQHFTMPELLLSEIGRVRGDLWQPSMLSDLARQFGRSLHNNRALRQAIPGSPESKPDADDTEPAQRLDDYRKTEEAHQRGAVLVGAVFQAFVAIFTHDTRDLLRLATNGSGITGPGAMHPDLVARLARTAADLAQRILRICIRALDYMPPVDPTFGDYLRALVTTDAETAPDHGLGYRVAFSESFARHGIYPPDITSVAPDSLVWGKPDGPVQSARLNDFIRELPLGSFTQSDRRQAFEWAKRNAALLHDWLQANLDMAAAESIGLDFSPDPTTKRPRFEVHSVRPAQRTTRDGEHRTDVVVLITQTERVNGVRVRGGCTLILDREYTTDPIRFAVVRPIWSQRLKAAGPPAYGPGPGAGREPFASLHRGLR